MDVGQIVENQSHGQHPTLQKHVIGKDMTANHVPDEWEETLACELNKLHEMDQSVCIVLHLDMDFDKHIYFKTNMTDLWIGWKDYIHHKSEKYS